MPGRKNSGNWLTFEERFRLILVLMFAADIVTGSLLLSMIH